MTFPPLHPILVNFTAALVPVSFVSDLFGYFLRKESLRATGWWTLCFAAIVTPFTALAGWWWLRSMGGMDRRDMNIHKWLGSALAGVVVLLTFWRARMHLRSMTPSPVYLVMLAITVAALTFQGHLGGVMSFSSAEPETAGTPPSPAGSNHLHFEPSRPDQPKWSDHIPLED